MKYKIMVVILVLFMIPVSAEDNVTIMNTINRHMENWLEIYQHLHANPELSYHEKDSSSFLAQQMRDAGFAVTERFGDYGVEGLTAYGVVAILKNGEGPVVLVRTDMDALPVTEQTGLSYASTVIFADDSGSETGVMHACGHDIHMTNFMAVGQTLAENRDLWSGTLMMIGQPAEEMGSGALAMLKGGLYEKFPRPDYALALHVHDSLPAGSVGFTPEYAMANVDSVDILVRGIGGHGALPQKTKDPIVLASQIILELQTISSRIVSPLDPVVVTVGSIHGGTKHNIIPDHVNLQLTVRTYKSEVREQVLDSIKTICRYAALSYGLPEELLPVVSMPENEVYTPAVYNDPALSGRISDVFRREIGVDKVVVLDPVMPGEDFSRYRLEDNQVPSFLFWLGSLNSDRAAEMARAGQIPPPLHSPMLAPDPEPTLRTGVRLVSAAVLELMGK